MADTKISALTALDNADLAADDVLPIVDTNAVATKKISVADLLAGAPGNPNVQQSDIGTAPNEVPLNQYLGSAAYVDIETLTAGALTNTTYISETEPTLDLNFAKVKALDPRITFARASTGTYWDGKTYAKAEENLLTYSEQFDNGVWSKTNATVTADATTAPDGTSTADKLIPSATSSSKSIYQTGLTVAGDNTQSIYVKADGYNKVALRESYAGAYYASFDLSAASVLEASGCTATITSVGNSWYRIAMVGNITGSTRWSIYILDPSYTTGSILGSWSGDGTSGVFLWGAQLEQRSAVSSYTPTTTQPITRYQPALQTAASGVARFDHNPVTQESLGLLVEEQRTNLLTYSEDFSNAAWTKTNATITSNTVVAPDGTLTGDKIVENTVNAAHGVYFLYSAATATYTLSAYVKSENRTQVNIDFGGGSTGAIYSLETTEVLSTSGGATATISNVGNGWYRVTATVAFTSGSMFAFIGSASSGSRSYTGDGYSGIYIWGAQLESGAFPTSYIPTVASQVTRSADAASMTGTNFSSWYRQDEGTLYADYVSGNSTLVQSVFKIEDGSNSNVISLYNDIGSASTVIPGFEVAYNGSTSVLTQHSASSSNSQHKFAGAYAVNNFGSSFDGSSIIADTSGSVPVVDRAVFGNNSLAAQCLNGTIKRLTYFPKRLDNAELVEMTEQ